MIKDWLLGRTVWCCGRCCLYSSIRISGYRGLDSFRMEGLGRINLLVGTNNSGKTSILECIELLRSSGNRFVLSSIQGRRGEWGYTSDEDRQPHLDVAHLFANRDLRCDVVIEANRNSTANSSSWNKKVRVSVDDLGDNEPELELDEQDQMEEDRVRFLRMDWSEVADKFKARLTPEGFLPMPGRLIRGWNGSNKTVQFIGTNGLSATGVVRLFDDLVLTESEEHVTQALRMVEPRIERIASVASERWPSFREAPSGVFLKLAGVADRIPIGSAGDGMWRMLGLALALANAKGGVLLVDEIDTGLHYSIMGDMWQMVSERAAALDVQVFATTHSRDCYESLAAIVEPDAQTAGVTIQRIDPGLGRAVGFSNDDILIAAERGLEVR